MTAIAETAPDGAHHLNGDLSAAPAAAEPVAPQADPELPCPGAFDDRRMAEQIADYALAKLRRYVAGSSEISSHFIELSIRLAEVYARLGEAPLAQPTQTQADTAEPDSDQAQMEFALDEQEAAIDQLAAPEPT